MMRLRWNKGWLAWGMVVRNSEGLVMAATTAFHGSMRCSNMAKGWAIVDGLRLVVETDSLRAFHILKGEREDISDLGVLLRDA